MSLPVKLPFLVELRVVDRPPSSAIRQPVGKERGHRSDEDEDVYTS